MNDAKGTQGGRADQGWLDQPGEARAEGDDRPGGDRSLEEAAWRFLDAEPQYREDFFDVEQQLPARRPLVISLGRILWVAGTLLTVIALAILIVMFATGERPGLTELTWVAVALLVAAREV